MILTTWWVMNTVLPFLNDDLLGAGFRTRGQQGPEQIFRGGAEETESDQIDLEGGDVCW